MRREPGSDLSPWWDRVILASIATGLVWIGWRRWTQVLIDYGRELYIAWRLSQGDVLYGDIAYFNGPFSPYLNAAVFRLLGVSYTTLFLFNLAVLAIVTWLLYRLLAQLGDRLCAVVGCGLFLIIFALADLTGFGNYNFVTPYSHEMTHATLLGLATLAVLFAYLRQPRAILLALAGFLTGLVFLTKAEFFLATIGALLTAIAVDGWRSRSERRDLLTRLTTALAGLLIPPLAAWALLQIELSPAGALRGVLGAWPYLFLEELSGLIFYRKSMGLDAPLKHLHKMAVWSALYAALLGPPICVALLVKPTSRMRRWLALVLALWSGGLLMLIAPRFDFTHLPRPLPVVLAVAVAIALLHELKRSPAIVGRWESGGLLAFEVYALLLLAKMALHPRFQNYGFALAMPAAMVLVVLLLSKIPHWIDRRGGYGPAFRLSALVFLLLVGVAFTWPSVLVYRQKNLPFGQGADMFRVQDRFVVMQRLLQRLPDFIDGDETLLALPEGIMLNYQLRLRNPTPYINFMPPELIMFGEEAILTAVEKSPPDVIVLVKRRTSEYGFQTIGTGYGEELMAWIVQRYPIVETVEDPELWGANFGKALILRRPVELESVPLDADAAEQQAEPGG